jgi:hypothetical protein
MGWSVHSRQATRQYSDRLLPDRLNSRRLESWPTSGAGALKA